MKGLAVISDVRCHLIASWPLMDNAELGLSLEHGIIAAIAARASHHGRHDTASNDKLLVDQGVARCVDCS